MNIFQAAFLGLVQGLTEFLPVSSSGHLVLFQKIFGLTSDVLSFDVFLHLGTLVAVLVVFRKDILEIIKKPFGKLPLLLLIGTIPAIVIGFTFKNIFESLFASGSTLGIEFIITGLILVWAEKLSCPSVIPAKAGIQSVSSPVCVPKTLPVMSILDALVIGIAQAVAIFPAISRSGATIAGALFRKLDRKFALKFSFLLSIPAIIGSAVMDASDIIKNPDGFFMMPTIIGTAFAAVSGYFAIRYMLKVFSKKSLTPFAIYIFIIGGMIIIDQTITHIFF